MKVLLDKYDVIVHEDLNIAGMMRCPKPKGDEDGKYLPNGASAKAGLNKSIADASWGEFLRILQAKALERGKWMIAVPPHYTSQDCSQCDTRVKKALSERTHRCPECGFVAPRDYNSSIKILRLGLQSLGIHSLDAATKTALPV